MTRESEPFYTTLLKQEPTFCLILGDFGRHAGIEFTQELSETEFQYLQSKLSETGIEFFDEYRLIGFQLVGEIRFAKSPHFAKYRNQNKPLDSGILVGVPNGLTTEEVTEEFNYMTWENIASPINRGIRKILVLNPCNSLSPASWDVKEWFHKHKSLEKAITFSTKELKKTNLLLQQLLRENPNITDSLEIDFPTVPEAVLRMVQRFKKTRLLPLGNSSIVDIYTQCAKRFNINIDVISLSEEEQLKVTAAIHAAVSKNTEDARNALMAIANRAREQYGQDIVVVEACTDFNYGVGLNSRGLYARYITEIVYQDTMDGKV